MGLILPLFRAVPLWAWALAAVLAWGAWQRHSATRATQALAAQQVQAEADRAQALHGALIETTRRLDAQKGIINAARQRTAAALADRAAAASAADSLREHTARLAARASTCDPAAADGGAAARAAGLVLADMQRRLEEAGRDAAEGLDAAYSAGLACEASYEALSK